MEGEVEEGDKEEEDEDEKNEDKREEDDKDKEKEEYDMEDEEKDENKSDEMKTQNERMHNKLDELKTQNERMHGEWMDLKREMDDIRKEMKGMKEELKRIDAVERDIRNRNVVIYGLDINYEENKYDTMYRLRELLANQMEMRIHEESIDNCFWLGRRKGRRPLLVKFTRGITREEVLERTGMLKGSRVWIERDYDFSTRKTRNELLPYLREARKNGKRATLKMDQLKIGNQLYDLEYCKKNFKIEERTESLYRRSSSQEVQDRRGFDQEPRGLGRARSQSPGRRSGRQGDHEVIELTQKDNEMMTQREERVTGGVQHEVNSHQERGRNWREGNQSPRRTSGNLGEHQPDKPTQRSNERRKLTEENACGGSQPEVYFRVGEPARMAESYTAGNVREEGLQTISSDSGSILRVNRGYRDVGSYFLRAGTSRRK